MEFDPLSSKKTPYTVVLDAEDFKTIVKESSESSVEESGRSKD